MEDIKVLEKKQKADEVLKHQIRTLRLVSRVLSAILSIAVFIPLALTVHKFLSTQNTFRIAPDPNNPGNYIRRTAWAHNSKVWPTYMYFSLATVSLVLNMSVLVGYMVSMKMFKITSKLSTLVTGVILVGNLTVWTASIAIYRYEKNLKGKSNDLWGWTCSGPAKALQKIFEKEVQFDTYCNMQSSSFYLGLMQVCFTFLTGFVYILVVRRIFIKKQIKRHTGDGLETS